MQTDSCGSYRANSHLARPVRILQKVSQYQQLGIERAVFGLPSEGRDKVLPLLDKYAALLPKFG